MISGAVIHRAALGCLLAAVAGCYRTEAPPALPGELAITVRSAGAHLVRSQGLMQREAARAVSETLGWPIAPMGGTRLELTLLPEDIAATAHDERGVPQRSSITIQVRAFITGPLGHATTTVSGTGNAASTSDEPEALADAARNAADALAGWLAGEPWIRR